MSLIQIKKWTDGSVIFEHECENNTMKLTLTVAVGLKIDLSYSDLSGSNLSGSNLSGSNLSGSNLRYSNLSGSDLSVSNLSGSNLSYSDLSGSNLSGSDLSGSDLPIRACRMDFGGWSICVYTDKTSIGCQTHKNNKWLESRHTDAFIIDMHKNASGWWEDHGDAIKAVIRNVMEETK